MPTFGCPVPSRRPHVIVPEFAEVEATGTAAYQRLLELQASRWRHFIGKQQDLYDRGLSFGDLQVEEFHIYMTLRVRWDLIGPSSFEHLIVLLERVLAQHARHARHIILTDKVVVQASDGTSDRFLLDIQKTDDGYFRVVLYSPAGADLAFALADQIGLTTRPAHFAHERQAEPLSRAQ